MKKNYIHTTCTLALLGMMIAGLWGCQTDDLAEQNNTPQGELQLTVTDGGYTTGQALSYEGGTFRELPQTRATESGYITTFTAGDQIGLYAVKDGALVATATNVCLTLTEVSGTLQWLPPTGVKLPTDANYYFAYYPYKSPLGNVTTTATTADAFFADIISAWTLGTDQSTTYPSKDLMVGSGTLGSTPVGGFYPLNITLTHKMGLAVIKLPGSATDAKFNDFTPYTGVTGEYRYLLKPSTETTLKGSFINSGEYQVYTIAATIAGGKYKIYTVDPQPQIGDYYYDNKTYSTTYDTKGGTRTCIGIVFYLTADGKHGKIVGLDEPPANRNDGTNEVGLLAWGPSTTTTNGTNNLEGLKNMNAVKTAGSGTFDDYPAFAWAHSRNDPGTDYSTATTGVWYLPAVNEFCQLYAAMCGLKWVASGVNPVNGEIEDWPMGESMPDYAIYAAARSDFNGLFTEIGKTSFNPTKGYWSSTEITEIQSRYISLNTGLKGRSSKTDSRSVRCIRAF